MNIKLTAFILLSFAKITYGQISVAKGGLFTAKEWSKEMSLYKAKTFVINQIIDQSSSAIVQFKIDALVASNSGDLTTLAYKSENLNKEGLILGFYGERWNEAGVIYTGYAFKDLPIQEATEFINRIDQAYDSSFKYISADNDNNNVYFTYKDIGILMYHSGAGSKLRIYWNGFDAEWQISEFSRTEKRFAKKLK
jgi:hypothetical protein